MLKILILYFKRIEIGKLTTKYYKKKEKTQNLCIRLSSSVSFFYAKIILIWVLSYKHLSNASVIISIDGLSSLGPMYLHTITPSLLIRTFEGTGRPT